MNRKTVSNIARILDVLSSFDIGEVARDTGESLNSSARHAADNAADCARSRMELALENLGLERRRSFGSRALEAAGWAGLGATAIAGASLASKLSGEDIERLVRTIRDAAATMASEADDVARQAPKVARAAASHLGTQLGDDLLFRLGLERREPTSSRVLKAAALIGAGLAIGAGVTFVASEAAREGAVAEGGAAPDDTDE